MLSFLSCKLINNYVEREVVISQYYYPWSEEREIHVSMYSTRSGKEKKIFTRVYDVPFYLGGHSVFDSIYYKLLDHYKTCTCKEPKEIEEYLYKSKP